MLLFCNHTFFFSCSFSSSNLFFFIHFFFCLLEHSMAMSVVNPLENQLFNRMLSNIVPATNLFLFVLVARKKMKSPSHTIKSTVNLHQYYKYARIPNVITRRYNNWRMSETNWQWRCEKQFNAIMIIR